jgi:poly(A) polymerase
MAGQITVVSPERIAEELRKMLAHPARAVGVRLLNEAGLVPFVLPELASADWDRLVRVEQRLPTAAGFPPALAALLHQLSPNIAEGVGRRLRLSNQELEAVVWLVGGQARLADAAHQPPSRLYPLLAHPGVSDLLALRRAIRSADGADLGEVDYCEQVLRDTPAERLNPPPLVTGDDLRNAGLTPGPAFKRLLDAVRAAQLDGHVHSKAEGLRLADQLARAPGP